MTDVRYALEALRRFTEDALVEGGLDRDRAAEAADILLLADLRGVASHGLGRLAGYVSRLQRGFDRADAPLEVLRETPSTLSLDGNFGLGLLIGPEAMRRTIAKAKDVGICMTTVRNSNHFGIAGTYACMAAVEGLGGMAMTNATRLVVPTFAREPRLGTNPLAFAVPTSGEPFVLDMSTSTVAWGKIEIARRAGLPIPEEWAVNAEGRPTTDPHQVKGLTPLGGKKEHSGHKGYGLGLMVEILTGPMSGNVWSNHVGRAWEQTEPPGTGHFFMAWRIDAFRDPDEFRRDMDEMIRELHETPTAEDAPGPVLVPGDPEAEAERRNRTEGVPIAPGLVLELRELAERLGIDHPFDTKAG
ncbi:MAG TPA: Ldh family oxidoreductase [Thermomicrobiales bacterium]|nr:Ldh family oxidoreductase [Thermomicrobiales bacterium]